MEKQQRHRPLTGIARPDVTDRRYLNEPAVIDLIIRDFTREALALVGSEDFLARLDFECRRMNSLFLGGPEPTDRYERAPWNAPDQMGEYVLKALQITGETRLAVRDAFMAYFSCVLDRAGDDREFNGASLEPLIVDLRGALTGNFASRTWPTGRK